MTRPKRDNEAINLTKQDLMQILTEDDSIKTLLQKLLQEVLEAEIDPALQAGKSERTTGRTGGYCIDTSHTLARPAVETR